MINKIFLALLIVAILVTGAFVFASNNWLYSIGKPEDAVANYEFYSSLGWKFLWISSLVLVVIANVILWTERKSWALWATFGYFAVFILLNTWWLSENLSAFKKQNLLAESGYLFNGIVGAILCIVVGIGIFFNQFIVLRLRDKMFDKPTEQTEIVATEEVEEKPAEEPTSE